MNHKQARLAVLGFLALGILVTLFVTGCAQVGAGVTSCKNLGAGWVSFVPIGHPRVVQPVKDAIACGNTPESMSLVVTWGPTNNTISEIRGAYTFTVTQPAATP